MHTYIYPHSIYTPSILSSFPLALSLSLSLSLSAMKTIMAARSPHESSFSFSRRHFQKIIEKVVNKEHGGGEEEGGEEDTKQFTSLGDGADANYHHDHHKKKNHDSSLSKFKSALVAAFVGRRTRRPSRRVCGTLFGYRRGHVHLAFQPDPKSAPTLLIELAMPTATLVREMASGLVRIALECDRAATSKKLSLDEEVHWRAYCNGKKCGFAERRACGPEESRVLRAVEPVTMGAGVLPGGGGAHVGNLGEMMYMRARFERVVGSRDSEAFYMMNPDGNSGPEFSLYLLRV